MTLSLLDWRRRVAAVYAAARAVPDPEAGWRLWRDGRDDGDPQVARVVGDERGEGGGDGQDQPGGQQCGTAAGTPGDRVVRAAGHVASVAA